MKPSGENIEAASLADRLCSNGNKCPIPFTHDRLWETHHWWHEMARFYHEPLPFRYSLGAFIQAARNVTFMLQKEQEAFRDFSWYATWRDRAKADSLLKWLHDTRNDFVHAQALEPYSWLSMRCLDGKPVFDEDEPPFLEVSPFESTLFYINWMHGLPCDHPHEWERFWGINTLPHRELLQTCAEIYDRMDDLVHEAHRRLGAELASHRTAESQRALPCMENILKHRIVRTVIRDGREILEEVPQAPTH